MINVTWELIVLVTVVITGIIIIPKEKLEWFSDCIFKLTKKRK